MITMLNCNFYKFYYYTPVVYYTVYKGKTKYFKRMTLNFVCVCSLHKLLTTMHFSKT